MEKILIKQVHYPTLEIDDFEDDCIQIISHEKQDPQIIFIERDRIHLLIESLQQCIEETK